MTIFISYSHRDKNYVGALATNLKPLQREYGIEYWDDSKIPLGKSWKEEIDRTLRAASVGVLLVSPDFLASEFINRVELPSLLNSAQERGLTICAVHVRPSVWKHVRALRSLQAANDPAKPIASLLPHEQEAAWAEIATRIADVLSERGASADKISPAVEASQELFEKVHLFVNKALDLKSAFQFVGDTAFHSEEDERELTDAVVAYNALFEDLYARGEEQMHRVLLHVPEEIGDELRELLLFALEDLHRAGVFQLNEVRVRINRVRRGDVPDDQRDAYVQVTREMMQPLVRVIADRAPLLERKTKRLREKISRLARSAARQ